jgi:DNA-binding NarL/FixJ family response regulator
LTKVIVADSEHLVRGAIVALLRSEPDLEVVADTNRSDEVVALARRKQAAVAVMEYNLPGLPHPLDRRRRIRLPGQEHPAGTTRPRDPAHRLRRTRHRLGPGR